MVPGVYKNSSILSSMHYNTELQIHCDSSVIAFFAGDLYNEKLSGNWKTTHDSLIIKFKPYAVRDIGNKRLFDYGHFDSVSYYFIGKKGIVRLNADYNNKSIADQKLILEYIAAHYKKFALKRVKKFMCLSENNSELKTPIVFIQKSVTCNTIETIVHKNILLINQDSSFSLEFRIYSKKDKKRPYEIEKYEGIWLLQKDTLILKVANVAQEGRAFFLFLYKKNALYLSPFIPPDDKYSHKKEKALRWKRAKKYPNYWFRSE